MKANNLSISVPYVGCDKNCPYCVSKMTGYIEDGSSDKMYRNLEKVKHMARSAQVTSVSFTGKGEPVLNWRHLNKLISAFKDFPCELQTNGVWLAKNLDSIETLKESGLDIIAISVDKMNDFDRIVKPVAERAHSLGLTIRVTLNITKLLGVKSFEFVFDKAKESGIDQFSIRNITIANYTENEEVAKWIRENTGYLYDYYNDNMRDAIVERGHNIRRLPYGAILYDLDGIAVTSFDYCIQDNSGEDDIRSLIFLEDGHLYTAWNSKASRIF